jgi:hypothetical protein
MRLRTTLLPLFACLGVWGVLLAQKPFHDYVGETPTEYRVGEVPLPDDWNVPHEWTRGRLKYTHVAGVVHPQADTGWMGWATDYPLGDRNFQEGLRRLTLIDATSVEHVVDLDAGGDDIYNWPFIYVVEPGHWFLYEDGADQLRDFVDRGGFLMTDDFHGTIEWENFMKGIQKMFGNRPVVDIRNPDPIFHVIYDLEKRTQIPGKQFLQSGVPYEFDGFEPKWRAIYDDRGRVVVAICHNMDLSDAIEHSNDPEYPEEWASMAYRIATNYVLYDLTH